MSTASLARRWRVSETGARYVVFGIADTTNWISPTWWLGYSVSGAGGRAGAELPTVQNCDRNAIAV
jgi:hypothetical protein